MSEIKRRPNKKDEFLLDVMPTTKEGTYTIYDISLYLPHWEGWDRKKYMERVEFSIVGKIYTIHIIDYHGLLTDKMARKLAGDWFNGNTTYHRLD
jgi:hypothetical protein